MFYTCTLVLLTLVPVVTGDNSGVKVKLTQRGLDIVAGKATEMFKPLIEQMDIPNLTFRILKKYTVTGMKMHIDTLHSEQKFVPNTGVRIKMKSANIHVTGNTLSGTSSGPFNMDLETLAISATVAVKVDAGHLKLKIKKCKTEMGPFHFDTGSTSLDVIAKMFSVFSSLASSTICSKMKTQLADLNPRLATLHDSIREFIGIEFSVEPPVISGDSIKLSLISLERRKKRRLIEETKDSPGN